MNHTLLNCLVGLADTPVYEYIANRLEKFNFSDVIDIIIVSVAVFLIWINFKKAKAFRYSAIVLLGMAALTIITSLLNLGVVSYILSNMLRFGLLGAVIILVMKMIDHFSKAGEITWESIVKSIKGVFVKQEHDESDFSSIESICKAAVDLSRTRTGGLIVIERKNKLDDLIHSGVDIDAIVSPYLIRNVFYAGAPLHDGAMIIRDERISAAGCILPITHSFDISPDLGTRHRAAIGLSETTDAVVIVISEESGIISVACNSVLTRDYQYSTLKQELIRLLEGGEAREDGQYGEV